MLQLRRCAAAPAVRARTRPCQSAPAPAPRRSTAAAAAAAQDGGAPAAAQKREDVSLPNERLLLCLCDANPYLSTSSRQAAALTASIAATHGSKVTVLVIDAPGAVPPEEQQKVRLDSISWHLNDRGCADYTLLEKAYDVQASVLIGEVTDEVDADLVIIPSAAVHSKHVVRPRTPPAHRPPRCSTAVGPSPAPRSPVFTSPKTQTRRMPISSPSSSPRRCSSCPSAARTLCFFLSVGGARAAPGSLSSAHSRRLCGRLPRILRGGSTAARTTL
jgi:hypothetical protein